MLRGNLTRDQAAAIVGIAAVAAVERENCEPTGRVGYNGACQNDNLCEWSACVRCEDLNGNSCWLEAYYYTTNEQDQEMADADGDGSVIDWEIAGYEVIS